MRLYPQDLSNHLKNRLHPFYFVWGEEPLRRMEACEAIRVAATSHGFVDRERYDISAQFDWEKFKTNLRALTLFSSKRFIECRFKDDKISKAGLQVLTEMATTPMPDMLFLGIAEKLESATTKTAAFAGLERQGILVWVPALTGDALLNWVNSRLQKANIAITEEGSLALVERTEGNLLALDQAIQKLSLSQSGLPSRAAALTPQDIHAWVSADARFSLFDLVDAFLVGSVERTKQIFWTLKREGVEPILILWAITREVRTIIPLARLLATGGSLSQGFREYNIWKHKVGPVTAFLKRVSLSKLHRVLIQAKAIDDILKGRVPGEPWPFLVSICLFLAGETVHV